jgi:hypothetical protein
VVKRLGGSVGVALLAVVLERHLPGEPGGVGQRVAADAAVAGAFTTSFWWVLGFCALAAIPAAFLPRRPATARRTLPRSGTSTIGIDSANAVH